MSGLIVYGDFNCPFSYLASQRVDRLGVLGVEACWRAVEHSRFLPATGQRRTEDLDGELAQVARLAVLGEQLPVPPAVISNSRAATAAFAESVSDGVADLFRRAAFSTIWCEGRDLSGAVDVRGVLASVMPVRRRGFSPSGAIAHPRLSGAPMEAVRREGGAVTYVGGPLTSAGQRRIDQWRQEWLSISGGVVPTVVEEDRQVHTGVAGLELLARRIDQRTAAIPAVPPGARVSVG